MREAKGSWMELDDVDELLVRSLQRDGRASYEDLAREVGLARSSVRARVQRLLDGGGLRVLGAIHPAVFDLKQLGHVVIETEGPVRPVADRVAALDETSFVTTTAGRFALTAELRVADMTAFGSGVSSIQEIPGVRSAQVMTYLKIWKDPYFPPGALHPIDLDAADHAILNRLRADGRATFTELADDSGLSSGATRARVLRLLDAGVVHVGALVRLDPLVHAHTVGFAVQLDGSVESIGESIVGFDEVDSFVTGLGWCNGIGTIRVGSHDEVFATLERLRAIQGVRAVESWTHLHAVKEEHDLTRTFARSAG